MLVVGKSFRYTMIVVKVYSFINFIELTTEITKSMINDCLPFHMKHAVNDTIYIHNIFYLSIKIR